MMGPGLPGNIRCPAGAFAIPFSCPARDTPAGVSLAAARAETPAAWGEPSAVLASVAAAWTRPGDCAALSKKRSSSTGKGITRVLFFSAATSATVCSSRSCRAAGSAAITVAASASLVDAWYSPSAAMTRARRSRSASACRDIDRFIDSGREMSFSSTRSTRIPHGSSVGASMTSLR